MSTFNFTNSKGESFEVRGPEGMTEDQARAIFDQQSNTGSLNGLSIGAAISAATQLAGGLSSASAMLSQATAGLKGILPPGTNLNSITSMLGPGGAAAATQTASSLLGGAASFNSLTTGASAATGAISKALSGGGNSGFTLPSPAGVVGALTGADAQTGSLASQTVSKIGGALTGAVTNGINIADFSKQGPALGGIDGMSLPDVTGALASASKLVGQGVDKISDALGVGKFGMDPKQLERAGLIKPGSAASFLASGATNIAAMLKSPKVWTGKDGATSLTSFLGNSTLQDKTQQSLMQTGLGELKQLGVPVDKLNPAALSGLATNAAKSVSDTVDWVKNSPSLPDGVKSAFDSVASAGAFAANFVSEKVELPWVKESAPEPAVGTVDAATVSAAAERIVGNSKVPPVLAT
jgi:hypothetical protein